MQTTNIFVSKPNALTEQQQIFWQELKKMFAVRGLMGRTLGDTDFPNCNPIQAVKDLMNVCDGLLILGFRQTLVIRGVEKHGTSCERRISNQFLPTVWNHIEAGIGFMRDIPALILKEEGVSGGVFDVGITDRFIHQAELSQSWLISDRFLQPFGDWCEDVQRRSANLGRANI